VEKLNDSSATRIPIDWDRNSITATQPYVLMVPTYGGGEGRAAIPRQVRSFLNIKENRNLLQGVVGFGNRNFGEHFCKAADLISAKTGGASHCKGRNIWHRRRRKHKSKKG